MSAKGMSLRSLYDEMDLPGHIRRSLNFILLGNIFGAIWGIICGGGTASMVGLATQLGADDLSFAILAAIPQIAALTQIPFSMLVNRTHRRKRYMLTVGVFSRTIWLVMGLIPLVVPRGTYNYPLWTLIFLLGISSCCSSMINVCWFPWLSDIAPAQIRSRWLSVRDLILNVCNVLMGFFIAYLLDALPPDRRYVIIFIIGGVIGILDMCCFAFCTETYSAPPVKLHYRELFADIWRNKPFFRFMVFWTAWCFTANMTGTYINPYSLNVMGLSFTQVMFFSTAASCLGAVLAVRRWGSWIYAFGSRNVMWVAGIGAALGPLSYLLAVPGSVLPVILHNFVGALFWSGTNLACNTLQLTASPEQTRSSYIAVFSCVTAMVGTALGSMSAGFVLRGLEWSGLFTGWFDRYKALFLLSTVLRLLAVLILVPRMENERPETARDMLASLFERKE